ncbi:hypothetical protein EHS25_000989 [Saitozyma podzolica]|uniref:FAD dependent oxidoreductase domain-containing protein n=1 Tax=Saitozyma podzolica TaxID=1890683 RepID=A0A427YHH9_9TREE|nr:hypothetical protein EHS25_000989 [Saitozyma podzolica]
MRTHTPDPQEVLPPVGDEATSVRAPQTAAGASAAEAASAEGRNIAMPLEEGMCLSYWLQGVRNNPLLDHRTTETLPAAADVVIIGSGITGTLCALELLQGPEKVSVVMLEARELCSGATGRNAGHCKPDRWRGFTKYSQAFGPEQALKASGRSSSHNLVGVTPIAPFGFGRTKMELIERSQILANEQETWEALVAYVRKHQVDCDLWVGKTLDVLRTEEVAEAAARTMSDFKAAGGDAEGIEITIDPTEAERTSRIKGARAVYAWDASTLYPWKLVAHVIQQALDLGLNLQTWTPATGVTGSGGDWLVHTERGSIAAPTVIHATNAYAPALLPEVTGAIRPTPHMCNKVVPPSSFSGSKAIQNSYAVIYPTGLYSINPRAVGDGVILFGGSAPNQHKLLEYVAHDPARRTDDSLVNFEPVTQAVRDLGKNGFGWDREAPGSVARYDYSWSGIIGRSADQVPFIGAVPGKSGQWLCAGHNGHGMARIFTAAPGLVKLIRGASWAETGLPECFQVTEGRLDKLASKCW